MSRKLEDVLIELGIAPNLKGFDYICKAIEILREKGRNIKIVDGIYAEIAKEYGTEKKRVERAIRHAISNMDKYSEAWKKYIGVKHTTNSAVLFTLSMRIKEGEVNE